EPNSHEFGYRVGNQFLVEVAALTDPLRAVMQEESPAGTARERPAGKRRRRTRDDATAICETPHFIERECAQTMGGSPHVDPDNRALTRCARAAGDELAAGQVRDRGPLPGRIRLALGGFHEPAALAAHVSAERAVRQRDCGWEIEHGAAEGFRFPRRRVAGRI